MSFWDLSARTVILTTLAVVISLAVVLYIYVGLCAVIIHNASDRSVVVEVSAAGEHLGSATLAPGERMRRLFYPQRDGEIEVDCSEGRKSFREAFGYVTANSNVTYRIQIAGCSRMDENEEFWP